MKRNIYILISLLFTCFACTNNENKFFNPDRMITYRSNKIDDTLRSQIVEYDSLINPSGIESIDSFVVILSGQSGKIFSVYNSKTNMLVSQFGRIGHSKNEFIDELTTCQLSHDKATNKINLTVQDYYHHKLSVFDFSNAIINGTLELKNNIAYGSNEMDHYAFSNGTDDYLLYKSISSDGDVRDKYTNPPIICVKSGQKQNTIRLFHKTVESSCKDFVEIIYFCFPHLKSDGTKLVNVFSYTDLITITDLNSLETTGISYNDSHDFNYYQDIAQEPRQKLFDNLIIQNACYNISENYIIVCQDHKTKIDDFETMTTYDTTIRIMDWEGTLLHTFHVNEPLMRIAFTESTKKLYGFDLQKKLYCYDLSKYIK